MKNYINEGLCGVQGQRLGHRIGSDIFRKMELGRLPSYGELLHKPISNKIIKKGEL